MAEIRVLEYPVNVYIFSFLYFPNIVDAPWYVGNSDLHRDLEIDSVEKEI
jgi:hypothetical protein